jgi:hypothetical protein
VREVGLDREVHRHISPGQDARPADEIVRIRARGAHEQAHDKHGTKHGATVALLALVSLAACQHDTSETSGAFYRWDGKRTHCAINLDTYASNDLGSVEAGLDRAVERGELLELYAHDPGRTVTWEALEDVLAAASARGLPFFTYADLAHDRVPPQAGVVLSFDDAAVEDWLAGSDLYARYAARVTFFVAYYDHLHPEQRASLHTLADAGHAIEAHSVNHLRAPLYVEQKGLTAYLRDEALPSIRWLRDDGFDVTTYAYPYGARTDELDDALLQQVSLVRSVAFTWSGVADPCPD